MQATTVDQDRLLRAARLIEPLSHPLRLRIVLHLQESGEQNVGRIVDAVGRPQPEVSRQLLRLTEDGLLQRRRDGHHVLYQLAAAGLVQLLVFLDEWVVTMGPLC